jgi:hypothetical protein
MLSLKSFMRNWNKLHERHRVASIVIAWAFFALVLYLFVTSLRNLY